MSEEQAGGSTPAGAHPRTQVIRGRLPGDRVVRKPRRRIQRLRRALGVAALFSTGYGNVGSSIYYALGVTTLYALGAAPLALMAAGVFFILTVLSYTEATVAVPEAGGASSFARRGFNELMSFFAGWATLLSYVVTISISSYSAIGYLAVFFPIFHEQFWITVGAVIAIVLLTWLNLVGVREAATLSVIFAVIDLVVQVSLVIVGGVLLVNLPDLLGRIQWGTAPTWTGFIYGISVAMVAYTGIETISNMAEEARNPSRNVPRSYFLLIGAVLVLFFGISVVALAAMPVTCVDGQCTSELISRYLEDPVAGIAVNLPEPFNHIFAPIVGILAFTILLIAANAGVLGASRLSFSMGAHRQIPPFFHRIHPTLHTPYVSILFFGIVAVILVIPGDVPQLADVYIVGAMLTFSLAHFSVVGMRIREPNLERPFKLPFNVKVSGYEIPITPLIGGIATAIVFVLVFATRDFGRNVGLVWVVLGIGLYIWYRRKAGLSIWHPAERLTHHV
ncbi:MAG TPA: APC family permease [Chloroflexota bacterium]|jgi:APA family basic amino acid/polyamine antiporter|nr:APC family permease [Chloroflexota bacterium]